MERGWIALVEHCHFHFVLSFYDAPFGNNVRLNIKIATIF